MPIFVDQKHWMLRVLNLREMTLKVYDNSTIVRKTSSLYIPRPSDTIVQTTRASSMGGAHVTLSLDVCNQCTTTKWSTWRLWPVGLQVFWKEEPTYHGEEMGVDCLAWRHHMAGIFWDARQGQEETGSR